MKFNWPWEKRWLPLLLIPEWPHRQGGCLACCGCTFDSAEVHWFILYARGAQGVLPMRVGGATRQLDLPSLTPLSVAACGWLQLGVPQWATSVHYCKLLIINPTFCGSRFSTGRLLAIEDFTFAFTVLDPIITKECTIANAVINIQWAVLDPIITTECTIDNAVINIQWAVLDSIITTECTIANAVLINIQWQMKHKRCQLIATWMRIM